MSLERIPKKKIVLAVALACIAPASMAQDSEAASEVTLQEVVITATRGEKAVEKIPGAVSVINRKDLDQQLLIAEDPSQALTAFVPGYAPSSQKMSQAGETFRGRTGLILFDGIPQSNPLRAGAREGYFADPAIIERIEVISGASAAQGLGATGGIINYISKTPKKMGTELRVDAKLSTQFKDDSLTWKNGYTLSHKNDSFDALLYLGKTKRAMSYDGEGRLIGMYDAQGDSMDSEADDVFLKVGKTFGDQRLQFSYNRFEMKGDGDYRAVDGDRDAGIPTSSERGAPSAKPPRNKVETASLDWRHADIGGGLLSAQLFKQDFAALYGGTKSKTFQDASIAPAGTLVDQSEIVADKIGLRTSWIRPDAFVEDLELSAGLDWLYDESEQRLARTNRTWVPPMKFTNVAPFVQLEYEFGDVTVRGGLRHERARLEVDDYTTLASYGSRSVEGGTKRFSKTVKNLGAIWRLPAGWSTFASYNEGFGLPDVGRVLRGVNKEDQTVSNLVDLQPIITDNKEVGLAWRGNRGSFSVSYYDSRSDIGSRLHIDSNGIGHVKRVPVIVKGWEFAGDVNLAKNWSAFGSYSRINGKTAADEGAPIDMERGAREQGPDKVVAGVNWRFSEQGNARVQAMHVASRHINEGRKGEEHFHGYTLADLAVSYQTSWGDVGLGVENIFDKQYIGYYSQAARSGDNDYFAGRGRTFTVSYSRTF